MSREGRVPPAIKFCGLTRPEDARVATQLGAAYVGVVFADGPRRMKPAEALRVLDAASEGNRSPFRVGVFGQVAPEVIARVAEEVQLDAVQLHGDPTAADVRALRPLFHGEIWAVVRIGHDLGAGYDELTQTADAVVLDTRSAEALGGTGVVFDWRAAAASLPTRPRPLKLVLAGGLRPSNVREAAEVLRPDVVDVSSGVESSPGVKDHALMEAFALAAARSKE